MKKLIFLIPVLFLLSLISVNAICTSPAPVFRESEYIFWWNFTGRADNATIGTPDCPSGITWTTFDTVVEIKDQNLRFYKVGNQAGGFWSEASNVWNTPFIYKVWINMTDVSGGSSYVFGIRQSSNAHLATVLSDSDGVSVEYYDNTTRTDSGFDVVQGDDYVVCLFVDVDAGKWDMIWKNVTSVNGETEGDAWINLTSLDLYSSSDGGRLYFQGGNNEQNVRYIFLDNATDQGECFKGIIPDTIAPNLIIEYPVNNSYISRININGTATDETAIDTTWINDTRFTNEGTDEAFNFVNNTGLSDGNYSVNITTNDTAYNQNTSVLFFIVDTVSPDWTINSIEADNSSIFYRALVNITLDDSVYDINLVNATINISNSTGIVWNQTLIATNDTLNFTNIIDISAWDTGTYNISYYAIDKAKNIQMKKYEFTVFVNNPPVIAGLNVRTDPIVKRETQYIDFASIDDLNNDNLTLICCVDIFNACVPTLENTILTTGNILNISNYTIINSSYTVGIEPHDEYIRCRVHDNTVYSNLISNSYLISSSSTDPIIYDEYFRYSDDIAEHDWFISPYNETIIPLNYSLYLNQFKTITLTRYINQTKTPLASIRFELNITNGTDPVGFGVYRWNEDEPYKLIPETILSLTFYKGNIYYKNSTIGIYNLSGLHLYELNLFFKTTKEYYNNDTKEIETYDYDTFAFQQDGIFIKQNIGLYATTTKYDDYYFDRLVWFKSPDVNMTLDTIIVYEGDNLVYNNIFEVLNPSNESGYMESFGGFEETQSYDFDCVAYPKCCEWITRKDGTQEQVASKTWCVFGTVAKGWMYGSGNKKGLMYYIENNLFGFLLIIFIIVIIYPVIVALRKYGGRGDKR